MRLLKKYERQLEALHKLTAEVETTREKLAKDCTHPETHVSERSRWASNGFGGGSYRAYKACDICCAQNHWGTWVEAKNISWREDD